MWRSARDGEVLDAALLQDLVQRRAPVYDKAQEGHYNLISALHKTIRGSDPDAALYYLCRMLDAGEDRLFHRPAPRAGGGGGYRPRGPAGPGGGQRRQEAFDFLGSPEGELALAQAAVYLATAPKSNALYTAYKAATRLAKEHGSLPPPRTILNAPTKLMRRLGYGEGYRYDHDEPDAFSARITGPSASGGNPSTGRASAGSSAGVAERMAWWAEERARARPTRRDGAARPHHDDSVTNAEATVDAGRGRPAQWTS